MTNNIINWIKIREQIFTYAKRAFEEEELHVSDTEIEESITILGNVIKRKLGNFMLDGFDSKVLQMFQEACIDKIGSVPSLSILLESIDPLMKHLLVLSGKLTLEQITSQRLTSSQLFEKCQIVPSFSANNGIGRQDPEQFKKDPNGLYLFAKILGPRNCVHSSPNWIISDVTDILKYLLAFYVWMVYKMKQDLLSNYPDYISNEDVSVDNNQLYEHLFLVDVVKSSASITEAKNNIVQNLVLISLLEKDEQSIDDLLASIDSKLESSFDNKKFKRLLASFSNKKLVKYDPIKNIVSIHPNQKVQLIAMKNEVAANRASIIDEITEILHKYDLENRSESVLESLISLYEYNYQDSLIDDINSEEGKYLKEFKENLKELGIPDTDLCEVTQQFFEVCRSNKYICNIAFSKTISKLSMRNFDNPDANRIIYLDTQIILYLLCLNEDYKLIDTHFYNSIKALSEIIIKNNKLDVRFASFYHNEVCGHLESAIALIPIVDTVSTGQCMSSNVFYKHYYTLKSEGLLPEGVITFADYLQDQFKLTYQDFLNDKVFSIASRTLSRKLRTLYINEEKIDPIKDHSIDDHVSIFKEIEIDKQRYSNRKIKSDPQINKDAQMGSYLFEKCDKEFLCPFFITLDQSFSKYRKKYLEEYDRLMVTSWRVFSLYKFINFIDLNNLTVKEDSLTTEIFELTNTDTEIISTKFFDALNKLTMSRDLSQRTRQELQRCLLEIDNISEKEDEDEKTTTLTRAMESVYEKFKEQWKNLCKSLENTDARTSFVDALRKVSTIDTENLQKLYDEIDKLIKPSDAV